MNRRVFLQSTAALGSLPQTGPRLEAIAAEELPLVIAVPPGATGPIVEIREYAAGELPDEDALKSSGMNYVLAEGATLMVNFGSLEARVSQWTHMAALQRRAAKIRSLAIYRIVG